MKTSGKIWNLFGILIGLGAIVIGIQFFTNWGISYGHGSLTEYTFGGDFYTYIYDAVRSIYGEMKELLTDLVENVNKGFGGAFILLGLCQIVRNGKELFCKENKKRYSESSCSKSQVSSTVNKVKTQTMEAPTEAFTSPIISQEKQSGTEQIYSGV